jgi:hypothetical protein
MNAKICPFCGGLAYPDSYFGCDVCEDCKQHIKPKPTRYEKIRADMTIETYAHHRIMMKSWKYGLSFYTDEEILYDDIDKAVQAEIAWLNGTDDE